MKLHEPEICNILSGNMIKIRLSGRILSMNAIAKKISLGFLISFLLLLGACAPISDKPTPDQAKQFLKLRGYNFDEESYFRAAAAGDQMAVNAFLAAGINPNVLDPERGETALIAAATRGDLATVKTLLDGGADINTRSQLGTTALFRALEKRHTEVADTLVAHPRLDLNAQSTDGWTVLIYYVTTNREEVVQRLLERGADPNVSDVDGDTALHRAAQYGNLRIMEMLLARGANANAKNKLGGTALMWAAAFGHDQAVTMLLDKGADPKLKDADGITAAGWATKNRREELAQRLREAEKVK